MTILEDEVDDKSKGVIKVIKAAASANRDLIFGYVGVKQWEDFVESFEVHKKTQLPKMIVWDGDEEYYTVSDAFDFLQAAFSILLILSAQMEFLHLNNDKEHNTVFSCYMYCVFIFRHACDGRF